LEKRVSGREMGSAKEECQVEDIGRIGAINKEKGTQ